MTVYRVGEPFSNASYSASKYVGKPLTSFGNTSIYGFQNEFDLNKIITHKYLLFSCNKWLTKYV